MLYFQIAGDLSLGFRGGGQSGQMIGTLVHGVVFDPFLAVLYVNSSAWGQFDST